MSLWSFNQSDDNMQSPQKRMQIKPIQIQRTSFCICTSGSYTLEAAIVLPLLAAYLVTFLFFFTVLDVQCAVEEALIYAGRKTAVESTIVSSEEVLFLSAEAYLLHALNANEKVARYVKYGIVGVSLLGSKIETDHILLKADYVIKVPISFGWFDEVVLSSQGYFRKWTGDHILEEGECAYVTPSGEVYHVTLSCRTLQLSVKKTSIFEIDSLRGKDGQKYYECGKCKWEDSNRERVYYTDYGTLYHKNIGCSSIKRNINKISIEEIGTRRPCSYCVKNEG